MLALSPFEGIKTADVVTGPYDIIVLAELRNQDELGRLVINKIHSLEGVKEALTDVKEEAARAEFKDGVLVLRIPKAEGSNEK